MSPAPAVPGGRGEFGLDLRDDGRGGVVVQGVDPGSSAAEALQPGDVIVEVNGAHVASASEAATRARETRKDVPLLLKVKRDGRLVFIALDRK
jgi:S1-C subfamily serine protease